MNILITNTFKQAAKKLHSNQKISLKKAIDKIQNNPIIGQLKTGDLSNIRVYKFRMVNQLILLAYTYDQQNKEITLISFATHENFYENLKNQKFVCKSPLLN